jgi:hypothetical protein
MSKAPLLAMMAIFFGWSCMKIFLRNAHQVFATTSDSDDA